MSGTAKEPRVDARNLWVPVTAVLAMLSVVWFGGRVYERISARAETTVTLAKELEEMNNSLSEVKGSLNTLMAMQSKLSEVSSDVGSLESRLNSYDVRLQTMDTWIQNTREKLKEQGFQTDAYRPGQ